MFFCTSASLTTCLSKKGASVKPFVKEEIIVDKDFNKYFCSGAVHMSRASPANRADSILSRLMVA